MSEFCLLGIKGNLLVQSYPKKGKKKRGPENQSGGGLLFCSL